MTAKVAKILSYMCARLVPPFYLRKIVCFRFVYKPKTWNRLLVVSTEESLICHTEKEGGASSFAACGLFLLVWEKRLLAVNRARLSLLPPCHSSSYLEEERDNFLCKLPPASDPPSSPLWPAIISFFSRRRRKMREIAVNWGWAKEEGEGH